LRLRASGRDAPYPDRRGMTAGQPLHGIVAGRNCGE